MVCFTPYLTLPAVSGKDALLNRFGGLTCGVQLLPGNRVMNLGSADELTLWIAWQWRSEGVVYALLLANPKFRSLIGSNLYPLLLVM